jgi:hypothetical protein
MGIFKNKSPGGLFSSFKSTEHSERLRNTFSEVQTFKRQLLKAEAGLRLFAKATDELLKTTDDSLSAFPRVWRKDDAAPNSALLPEEDITKSAPTTKKLGTYPSQQYLVEMDAQLNEEVYHPIAKWHKQYQVIKTRIASVEHARLEYDSARKDLASAREAILKHARKTDGRSDPALEAAEAQAESILATKRDYYIQLEETVHNELVNAAADAQQTLGYVARALHIEARALMQSGDQLRERESMMPAIDRQSSGPLNLGTGASVMGSPVGTPTSASPTGYGASFRTGTFNDSPPTSVPTTPTTAEQVAAQAKGYKSGGSGLGDSGRMGRFDEAAAYAAESKDEPNSSGVANLHLGREGEPPVHPHGQALGGTQAPAAGSTTTPAAGSTAIPAATETVVSDNIVRPQSAKHETAPAARTGGVQDSANEFPPAPTHTVEAQEEKPARTGIMASIFGTGSAAPQPAS